MTGGNYYASAFFSQQAVEKGLKGVLYSRGFRALITHSVVDLVEEVSKSQKSFQKLIDIGNEIIATGGTIYRHQI
ncbi:MAG TPA: HEPN domain-containing protein [Dehalococcoidia bacterium]|nr:HEPN domain-containing protein [Dehalococcoidia bacterium]